MAGSLFDMQHLMWLEANFKVSFYQPEDLLAGMWFMNSLYPGTDRQFECHKSITSQMVIDKIQNLLK